MFPRKVCWQAESSWGWSGVSKVNTQGRLAQSCSVLWSCRCNQALPCVLGIAKHGPGVLLDGAVREIVYGVNSMAAVSFQTLLDWTAGLCLQDCVTCCSRHQMVPCAYGRGHPVMLIWDLVGAVCFGTSRGCRSLSMHVC